VGGDAQNRFGDPAQRQEAEVVVGVVARVDGMVEPMVLRMLPWLSMTPLGRPVVPEV
jgi:hypothetical protein